MALDSRTSIFQATYELKERITSLSTIVRLSNSLYRLNVIKFINLMRSFSSFSSLSFQNSACCDELSSREQYPVCQFVPMKRSIGLFLVFASSLVFLSFHRHFCHHFHLYCYLLLLIRLERSILILIRPAALQPVSTYCYS